jgi:fatty acid desaturase
MNDTTVRHLVAIFATFVALMAYIAGYISGGFGWWWTAFATLIVYGIMYRLIDAGGHGGH